MSSVNKVIILGRLGTDPEIRFTPSGAAVANFSVATSEKWADKQTGEVKERTEWHRIVVWGKLGELCGKYLSKGRQAYIEGSLQTRKWEKDGIDRYSTEIKAREVTFIGGDQGEQKEKPRASGPAQGGFDYGPGPQRTPYDDSDIPF